MICNHTSGISGLNTLNQEAYVDVQPIDKSSTGEDAGDESASNIKCVYTMCPVRLERTLLTSLYDSVDFE